MAKGEEKAIGGEHIRVNREGRTEEVEEERYFCLFLSNLTPNSRSRTAVARKGEKNELVAWEGVVFRWQIRKTDNFA